MKRTLIAICVLALVIGVFVGCNPGNRTADSTTPPKSGDKKVVEEKVPDSVVQEIFATIENRDPEKFLTLMVPEAAEKVKADPENTGALGDYYNLAKVLKEHDGKIKFSEMKITEGKSTGSEKVVTIDTISEVVANEETSRDHWRSDLTFVKADDKWLLTEIKEIPLEVKPDAEKNDENKSDEGKASEEKSEE